MTTAIVPGSLQAIAKQTQRSLAETFVSADVVVIVDTSGSMTMRDIPGDRTRYDTACDELRNLQATLPGRVAVISFNTWPEFNPAGIPGLPTGSTNMARALEFARIADLPGMSFFLISDGAPDSETDALAEARQYTAKINTIYVGPEWGQGQEFLAQLAAATGGKHDVREAARELESGIRLLLSSGG